MDCLLELDIFFGATGFCTRGDVEQFFPYTRYTSLVSFSCLVMVAFSLCPSTSSVYTQMSTYCTCLAVTKGHGLIPIQIHFSELKGPKHEIFGSGVFTQIRSVWVGDLGTRQKIQVLVV